MLGRLGVRGFGGFGGFGGWGWGGGEVSAGELQPSRFSSFKASLCAFEPPLTLT